MKRNFVERVFILDKSGSMSGLACDNIGEFNSMLEKQREVDGICHITTVLFDNTYNLLHDRIDIRTVSDTLAAITGGIAEAAYGIPQWIEDKAWEYLDEPLRNVCRKWRD